MVFPTPIQVMLDIGLVVAVRALTHVEDAVIYPLDGAAHHRVACELVVFRPCLGELLVGTIVGASADGLRISLGFFEVREGLFSHIESALCYKMTR